jgi:hypothetical protein
METVLYPEQYKLIYNISFLCLISSIYAVYQRHYLLSIIPGGVFLTSINYWRYPDYSWRRYLDMICVKSALLYQLYRAYNSQYMIPYYSLMLFTVSMYPLGIYFYKKKLLWHSTYAHCILHITANISTIILYSGRIK